MQVSGEYAMLYHAAQAGAFDMKEAVLETLGTCFVIFKCRVQHKLVDVLLRCNFSGHATSGCRYPDHVLRASTDGLATLITSDDVATDDRMMISIQMAVGIFGVLLISDAKTHDLCHEYLKQCDRCMHYMPNGYCRNRAVWEGAPVLPVFAFMF